HRADAREERVAPGVLEAALDREQPFERVVLVRDEAVEGRRRVVLRLRHARIVAARADKGQSGNGASAAHSIAAGTGSSAPRGPLSETVISHGPRRAVMRTLRRGPGLMSTVGPKATSGQSRRS